MLFRKRAPASDPYEGLWAAEGRGYAIEGERAAAAAAWDELRDVLGRDAGAADALPRHTGAGLGVASVLLEGSGASVPAVVERFRAAIERAAAPRHRPAALENLGLAVRMLRPEALLAFDRHLRESHPDMVDLFWHGAGRGGYFAPSALCSLGGWPSLQRVVREAPDGLARCNAVAGLAWALTLVNGPPPGGGGAAPRQRSATAKATDGSTDDGAAAAHGVASALALWRAVTGDGATVDGFLAGVAEARTARTARPRRRRRGSPAPHGHCWLGSCAPAATRDAWRRPSAPARGTDAARGSDVSEPAAPDLLQRLDGAVGRALHRLGRGGDPPPSAPPSLGDELDTNVALAVAGDPRLPEEPTSREYELLTQVELYLDRGRELLDWWRGLPARRVRPALRTRPHLQRAGHRLRLLRHRDRRRPMPVMGNFQEMFYDQPKAGRNRGVDGGVDARPGAGVRAALLHAGLRLRAPQGFADSWRPPTSSAVSAAALVPRRTPALRGFGFQQLYYKRRGRRGAAAFPDERALAIVDLRELGERYEWIVVKVCIFDFEFHRRAVRCGRPAMSRAAREESYLCCRADLRDRRGGRRRRACCGRYGVGYAFIQQPDSGHAGVRPGRVRRRHRDDHLRGPRRRLGARADGLRRQPAGAHRRTSSSTRSAGPRTGCGMTWPLGLRHRGTAPSPASPTPCRARARDRPGVRLHRSRRRVSGGLSADRAVHHARAARQRVPVQHYMQHYQTIAGSLATWRLVPDWLRWASLPRVGARRARTAVNRHHGAGALRRRRLRRLRGRGDQGVDRGSRPRRPDHRSDRPADRHRHLRRQPSTPPCSPRWAMSPAEAIADVERVWLEEVVEGPCGNGVFRWRGSPFNVFDLSCLRQTRGASSGSASRTERSSSRARRCAVGLRAPPEPVEQQRLLELVNISNLISTAPFPRPDPPQSTSRRPRVGRRSAGVATNWRQRRAAGVRATRT